MKLGLKTPSATRLLVLLVLVVPALSWAIVKPIRVMVPSFEGVSCSGEVCVDDASRRTEAGVLYSQAIEFVATRFGVQLEAPRVVFCSSQRCADSFGLGARSAVTIGTVGTVIGPHAWKPFYVRHELIHQLQSEKYGVFGVLIKPAWLIEGMAYSMSEDPRPELARPWQQYRSQFEDWHSKVGDGGIWTSAPRF